MSGGKKTLRGRIRSEDICKADALVRRFRRYLTSGGSDGSDFLRQLDADGSSRDLGGKHAEFVFDVRGSATCRESRRKSADFGEFANVRLTPFRSTGEGGVPLAARAAIPSVHLLCEK